MGQQLQAPVTTKVLERWSTGDEGQGSDAWPCFRAGVATMMGWRSQMEDRYAVSLGDRVGLLGVFDGHGGEECSQFLAERIPQEMSAWMNPEEMARVALKLDSEFLSNEGESGSDISGSTSTVCMVRRCKAKPAGYQLAVSHVGDCRLLLCRMRTLDTPSLSYNCPMPVQTVTVPTGERIEVMALTRDHRPDDEEEEERIVAASGSVINNRVNGTLATSRAFGDSRFKRGGRDGRSHQVTAVPEVRIFDDCRKGDVIVLCSDGVFEGCDAGAGGAGRRKTPTRLTDEALVSFIFSELSNGNSLASAASAVCDEALQRGSRDNITCLLANIGDDTRASASVLNLQKQVPGAVQNCSFGSEMASCVSPTAGGGRSTYADSSINLAEILNLTGLTSDGKKLAMQRGRSSSTMSIPERLTRIRTLKPGPVASPESAEYMLAYQAAAQEAGLSAAEAAERRYSHIARTCHVKGKRALCESDREELESFRREMPQKVASGKRDDRIAWFDTWLEGKREKGSTKGGRAGPPNALLLDESSDDEDVLQLYCNSRVSSRAGTPLGTPQSRRRSVPPEFPMGVPTPTSKSRRVCGFASPPPAVDTGYVCYPRISERDREEVRFKMEEDGEAICGGEAWFGVLEALEAEVATPERAAMRTSSTTHSSESCSLTATHPSHTSNPSSPSPEYTFGAAEIDSDSDSEDALNHCVS